MLAGLALLPKLEVSNSVPAFPPSRSPGVGGVAVTKSSNMPTQHYGARERREDCFFLLF